MTEAARLTAVRRSYDTVAADYERLLADQLDAVPLDRAVMAGFAEEVERAGGPRTIGDLGCGTGRVTSHLRSIGAEAFGVDLSPGMIAVARATHPGLRFEVGSTTALDLPDASLGGVLSWYATVHMPEDELTSSFAEFHRALAPGGRLLLAFKVGDGRVRLGRAYGHEVALDVYRRSPDRLAELLAEAGLVESARLVREPDPLEKTPQGFLLARKPRD
ncbi:MULTISPECIES: class I SAM-dependent DNA methyltransferase [unclassified Streptomyces]|uniref:class I SAM-dependent DNA methyltransferase n=1 Tax=unclassified Streptomyces TaxID=2593676 RepID=UPI0006AE7C05|nr:MULTISPECIES: class I SAM-dependent methyltransferase [unclassified Streptomyces]KOX17587.1 methyltransferase [Streptomyces sp. NRRL F-6491]KOX52252.1 methyltransferase [Streptomyces sp. NRRL F-6492]